MNKISWSYRYAHSFTYSLTHSVTHQHNHTLIRSLTHSFIHSLTRLRHDDRRPTPTKMWSLECLLAGWITKVVKKSTWLPSLVECILNHKVQPMSISPFRNWTKSLTDLLLKPERDVEALLEEKARGEERSCSATGGPLILQVLQTYNRPNRNLSHSWRGSKNQRAAWPSAAEGGVRNMHVVLTREELEL